MVKFFFKFTGLTETQSAATWLKKADHRTDEEYQKILQSCGKSTNYERIKIVDELGNKVSRGEEGEIAVKALTNLIGYHKLPEKTAETMKRWLVTHWRCGSDG